jgi:hypothetical protein
MEVEVNQKNRDVARQLIEKPERARRRRRSWLWIGLGIYLITMLNALRYTHRVPYQVFILGALMNLVIIATFIIALTRAYKSGS